MAQHIYQWLAIDGGTWSLAANWSDITATPLPAATPPGAADSIVVRGATATAITTLSGGGTAAVADFAGNTKLAGNFAFSTLALGAADAGGLLSIAAGSGLATANTTVGSGSLIAAGGRFSCTGSLILGAGQSGIGSSRANLGASQGGMVAVAQLFMAASGAGITVDATSTVEIGTLGTAQSGTLTIDPGATLGGQGQAQAYGPITNNGTILASGGTLMLGALNGQGALAIAGNSVLILNGRTGAAQTVTFLGTNATLAMSAEINAPSGAISGFGVGDAIDMLASPITGARYAPGTAGNGTLTLTYGGQVAAKFTLAGDYSGYIFVTASDGAGGTVITTALAGGGGGGVSPGTPTPDVYAWNASRGGAWNSALNWADLTTNATPAAVAPGRLNQVTIAGGASDAFAVVTGPGRADHLTITGAIATTGTVSVNTLTIGATSGGFDTGVAGTLDILTGSALSATTGLIASGAIAVLGNSASLALAATLTLGGGASGIGLPRASLSAGEGAIITVAGLTLGGGAGDSVTTDPVSVIEIGTAGGAALGAITIDAGAQLIGNGVVNPFGRVVNNGTITASGGVLAIGATTGTGTLVIANNATLALYAKTALPISFSGTATTLELTSELYAPSGTLSGFVPGDTIDFAHDPISAANFTTSPAGGTLTLSYNGQTIAKFLLAGSFANERFYLLPDATGGTVVALATTASGGGTTTQGNTDLLAWANPVSGGWSRPANWTDLTTGKAAIAPPGSQNAVQITGASGAAITTIGGPAAAASLSLAGNIALSGTVSVGNLSIGLVSASAWVSLAPATTCAAGTANLTNGALVIGTTTAFSTSGNLIMGSGAFGVGTASATLTALNHGFVQLAGLQLGGGQFGGASGSSVSTDGSGTIEIGSTGGAQGGAITIDAGLTASGNGALNIGGAVINNGTLAADGGTLTLGAVSGAGTLSIGADATLQLTTLETCVIDFAAPGGALILPSTSVLPTGVITDFAQGDMIYTGNAPVSAVRYTPGGGGIGTLSLYYGTTLTGQLQVAGNYAGDIFNVTQAGLGAAITVVPSTGGGVSAGTTTPDQYQWTGTAGINWNTAGNWADISASQPTALVAPGRNNLVSISGATTGGFTTITGPGICANLSLSGQIAMGGTFTAGRLTQAPGSLLALSGQSVLYADSATINGAVSAQDGTLTIAGALTMGALGALGGSSPILLATNTAKISAAALVMTAAGSALMTDTTASIEIGGATAAFTPAMAGTVWVDQSATLSGQGVINPSGRVVDNGMINACGGTLVIGTTTGNGTLAISQMATLALTGTVASDLNIDFLGAATLVIDAALPAATISDFGAGDTIVIAPSPQRGPAITVATYIAGAGATGMLLLQAADGTTLGSLTLRGINPASRFTVAGFAGGPTTITIQPAENGGGPDMTNSFTLSPGPIDSNQLIASQVVSLQPYLRHAINGATSYVWQSVQGDDLGPAVPIYANIAFISAPLSGGIVYMPAGYAALIAQGTAATYLVDGSVGNAILVGNIGNDTLVGAASGDTLIGGNGVGTATTFFASTDCTVVGGGNDEVITGNANVEINTSPYHSLVFAGPAANLINSNGQDTIVGAISAISDDTINAYGRDLIFAPSLGRMTIYERGGVNTVVSGSGEVVVHGGPADGTEVFGGTGFMQFIGGTGQELIVEGTGDTQVLGGAGAITLFGGIGHTEITGAPGASIFVVGNGQTTVQAASGNLVFLIGNAACSVTGAGDGVQIVGSSSLADNFYQAGSGHETIIGGQGNDMFTAGRGNVTLAGGAGADTISFTNGLAGGDVLWLNLPAGKLTIDLHGYAGTPQSLLASATLAGGNLSFDLSDGTHITLQGISSVDPNSIVMT